MNDKYQLISAITCRAKISQLVVLPTCYAKVASLSQEQRIVIYSLFLSINISWCNTIHELTNQERERMRYLSCPMSQKAAHKFTFTLRNNNYRPLSRRDTKLESRYTLYMNSLKDY